MIIKRAPDPVAQRCYQLASTRLPACVARRRRSMARATGSAQDVHGLLQLLADAHAHPQLDVDHLQHTVGLQVPCIAAMGVATNVDWANVERLAQLAGPDKVIPGFGIHPWWSHLHGSSVGATWEELLEGPSPEEISKAISMLTAERQKQRQQEGGGGDITAAGQYEAGRRGTAGGSGPSNEGGESGEEAQQAGPSGSSSSRRDGATDGDGTHRGSSRGGTNGGGGNDEHKDGGGDGPLDIVPHDVWRARMRSLLSAHPKAIVGEVGVDRAAVIPGSKAKVKWEHQLALLREQLELAAELGRPVSVHCVRGYGHLLQLFAGMPRGEGCPPAVMLHSYGGSPEEVGRFCRLPVIGGRFFFSVSSAINARTPEKLAARIKAVPDDRLLIESDQVTPLLIDEGMCQICSIVAGAKGWSLGEAARRTHDNFKAFYFR